MPGERSRSIEQVGSRSAVERASTLVPPCYPRTHSHSRACLLPTRNARHGTLNTRAGTIHIGQGKYKSDFGPIDPTLETIGHSRAYLHHLFRVKEPLFTMLASQHNLQYMGALVAELREQIAADEI